jgi:hypothetical protein
MKVSEVFVPGGLPKYTYVPRAERGLEEQLSATKDNLCKVATVTGATKSGKTVLVRKVFGDAAKVWVDGGHVKTEQDFWNIVGSQLEVVSELERSNTKGDSSEIGAEATAEAGVLFAKGSAKASAKAGRNTSTSEKRKIVSFTPWKATEILKATRTPLVIDDFHYLPRPLQGSITRSLKPLVFEGLPVVYLAIPHRRYDAVKVEREMNGRIESIEVPTWTEDELIKISELGFPLLNVTPDVTVSTRLAKETQGSPHLMQEFCRNICYKSGFRERPDIARTIVRDFDYGIIFREVARDLGKSIYDKLASGPRQRTDRMLRLLKTGKSVDIYKVVLLGLAHLKPGVETVEYEELRNALRAVLDEELPQAHEISRVLEQMAKVSSLDESSVPVIDYEKEERKLHVTDPFFAFFLRWGGDVMDQ